MDCECWYYFTHRSNEDYNSALVLRDLSSYTSPLFPNENQRLLARMWCRYLPFCYHYHATFSFIIPYSWTKPYAMQSMIASKWTCSRNSFKQTTTSCWAKFVNSEQLFARINPATTMIGVRIRGLKPSGYSNQRWPFCLPTRWLITWWHIFYSLSRAPLPG